MRTRRLRLISGRKPRHEEGYARQEMQLLSCTKMLCTDGDDDTTIAGCILSEGG